MSMSPTKTTPDSTLSRLAAPLALVLLTSWGSTAQAAGAEASVAAALTRPPASAHNRIDGLGVEELDDGTTTLHVVGSKKPTFNVYRLSGPDRLVVDIAGSETGTVVPHIPLDTWACGRVTIDGVSERDATLVRVVIELKREASYIVLPKGNELVVTVTPREVPPEAYFAHKSAAERRDEIERSSRDAKALRAEAQALNSHAKQQQREADKKVVEAAARAKAAKRAEDGAKAAERRAATLEEQARTTLADAKSRKYKLRRALKQAAAERQEAEALRKRAESERKQAEGALASARAELAAERASLQKARTEVEAERGRLAVARDKVEADAAAVEARAAKARTKAAVTLKAAQLELRLARRAAEKADNEAKATLSKAAEASEAAALAARRADADAKKKLQQAAAQAEAELRKARADAKASEAEGRRALSRAQAAVAQAEQRAAEKEADAVKAEARAKALLAEARAQAAFEAEQTQAKAQAQADKKLAAASKAEADARRKAAKVLADAEAQANAKIAAATKTAARKAKEQLAAAEVEATRRLAEAKRASKSKRTATVAEAEKELARLRAKSEAEIARQVAAARSKAETEAEKDLGRARARATALEAEARAKLAHAESRLAEAEAAAKSKTQSAAALERQARAALARAETALADAERERKAAASARSRADATLVSTRREVRQAQRRGKSTAELERSLASAKKQKAAADRRLAQSQKDISALQRDRNALSRTLEQQRVASKALAVKIARRGKELSKLEKQRDALSSEGSSLEQRNAATKAELSDAETKLAQLKRSIAREEEKLHSAQGEVGRAQKALDARVAALDEAAAAQERIAKENAARQRAAKQPRPALATKAKASAETKPKTKTKAKPDAATSTVRDVRFEDDAHESRIIVEVDGPLHYEGKTLTPDIQLLALDGVKIDPSLERSLDTRAYGGSVERITSFAEDGGAKVIVATQGEARPRIEQANGQLIWHFPHSAVAAKAPRAPAHEVSNQAGSKVGGFAATPPPMAAARTTAMAPASASPRTIGATGGSSAPKSTSRRARFRGERIDIELQDAPIKDVLLLFSDIGDVNIIAGRDVAGNVTMKLKQVPWDQALDIILRSLNLGMVREGNVIRVATSEALDSERREAIEQANARVQLKPLTTRLLPISYATADEMVPKVQSVLSPRGTVTPDTRTNQLIVMDVADNIAVAEQLVNSLDTQTPQVLIEARIVEARTNFQRQLGIQWGFDFTASPGTGNPTGLLFPNSLGVGGGGTGTPVDARGLVLPGAAANPNYVVDLPAPVGTGAGGALGFSFGSISGNLNTNLRLSQAEETGEVRIISAPKIVTLDNSEAQIEQGVQIPISQVSAQGVNTRFVNATLSLRVTPHVTNEGAVLLDVQVQKNEADFINTGARGDPTILTKQAQSRMLVNDSDTAVIGGIYTRNKAVNFTKVPWLADIPIIGWFFKNKSEADTRSEVLIFLTPKIVNRASSIGG